MPKLLHTPAKRKEILKQWARQELDKVKASEAAAGQAYKPDQDALEACQNRRKHIEGQLRQGLKEIRQDERKEQEKKRMNMIMIDVNKPEITLPNGIVINADSKGFCTQALWSKFKEAENTMAISDFYLDELVREAEEQREQLLKDLTESR